MRNISASYNDRGGNGDLMVFNGMIEWLPNTAAVETGGLPTETEGRRCGLAKPAAETHQDR